MAHSKYPLVIWYFPSVIIISRSLKEPIINICDYAVHLTEVYPFRFIQAEFESQLWLIFCDTTKYRLPEAF